jgi:hypothetical protein
VKTLTEEEWLSGVNPAGMVNFLRQRKASERKLRLFGCACCHRVWARLPSEASRQAVAVAERFADGLAKRKDLNAALLACNEQANKATHDPAAMVVKVSLQMASFWASYNARVQAAGTEPLEASQIAAHTAAMNEEGLAQGNLLHDIFGNPFRPVTIERNWLTATVVELARTIYDDRFFDRMPILADALMDVGCEDDAILEHCRSNGPHVRGCWVVDLILGKN